MPGCQPCFYSLFSVHRFFRLLFFLYNVVKYSYTIFSRKQYKNARRDVVCEISGLWTVRNAFFFIQGL